jgi:NADPH:quinone reductase-like Zn-dependent oxidoreductase
VGIAAFQVARAVGAIVIATTRTSAKRQALLDNGAHHVITTEEEDLVTRVMEITNGFGARVVFDPVGGPSFEPLTQSMSRGGILLTYGALSSERPLTVGRVVQGSCMFKARLNSNQPEWSGRRLR